MVLSDFDIKIPLGSFPVRFVSDKNTNSISSIFQLIKKNNLSNLKWPKYNHATYIHSAKELRPLQASQTRKCF